MLMVKFPAIWNYPFWQMVEVTVNKCHLNAKKYTNNYLTKTTFKVQTIKNHHFKKN